MKQITSIQVTQTDDATGETETTELTGGKIIKSVNGVVTKTIEGKEARILCEILNANMGMIFSRVANQQPQTQPGNPA